MRYFFMGYLLFCCLFFIFVYGFIDYYGDFFTIKILTIFLHDNTCVYERFNKMKLNYNNYTASNTFDYYMYSFFILDLVSFYINSFFILFSKNIYNSNMFPEYKENIKAKNMALFMHFSLFYCYYLSITFNDYFILANGIPITIIIKFLQ